MLVTDKNDYVQSYALTIKNVKLIANNVLNITVRRSRQSGVARATCPD